MAAYQHAEVGRAYFKEATPPGYRYYAELPSGTKVFDPGTITAAGILNLLGSEGWALIAIAPGAREIDSPTYWLRREG